MRRMLASTYPSRSELAKGTVRNPAGPCYTGGGLPGFERSNDSDRPGQLLLQRGEPVALVFWAHDFAERARTGWFLTVLDDEGEPDGRRPTELEVSDAVAALVANTKLDRSEWLAQAETVELVTAADAVDAGERLLEELLGG
jgi:hypothetical protein